MIVPFPTPRPVRSSESGEVVSDPEPLQSRQPNRLDGLFGLRDRQSLGITFDSSRSLWLLPGGESIVDDVLTAVCIYTFGREDFKRLVIDRPSLSGIEMLRHYKDQIRALVKEFPPRRQIYGFGIAAESEPRWRRLIEERQAKHQEIFEAIRSGRVTPLRRAA